MNHLLISCIRAALINGVHEVVEFKTKCNE